jgi:hypothetical protein
VKVCALEPGGMRTNGGARANKDTPDLLPDYEPSVGAVIKALQPNAGYGNGSATANATHSFAVERAQYAKPPKRAAWPPATITLVDRLGDAAFVAVQVFHFGVGTSTNKVILLVRYKNVLISTSMQGDARRGGDAAVQRTDLKAGVLQIARALLSAVKAEPATG